MNFVTSSVLGGKGRLGNQLFQISAVVGLATKFGLLYRFLPSYLNWYGKEISCSCKNGIGNFELTAETIADCGGLQRLVKLEETRFNHQKFFLTSGCNYDLQGYFQAEQYFSHCRTTIARLFELCPELSSQIKYISPDVVAMHVRRGDYVGSASPFHDVKLVENGYYLKAYQKLGCSETHIFSDDPVWCEQNLRGIGTNVSVRKEIFVSPFMVMHQMAKYSKIIMANSSFSWWSAWLSKWLYGLNPVVIAPDKWFTDLYVAEDKDKANPTCYCEGWIRL